jgi:hypothetical protein
MFSSTAGGRCNKTRERKNTRIIITRKYAEVGSKDPFNKPSYKMRYICCKRSHILSCGQQIVVKGVVEGCSVKFAVFGGPPVKSLSLPADVKED